MSDFGEAIIERLPLQNPLQDSTNPMNRIIHYTIGEWLDKHNEKDFFEQFFLQDATGKYLDLHGQTYGVRRKVDESDTDYRKRIIYETLGHVTVDFLVDVYGVELYTKITDFDATDNTLTSDNQYLASDGFMGVADTTTKTILNKKFIIGTNLSWVIL